MLLTLSNILFRSGPFIPHGHCYLWKTGLVWLHIISDLLIALAYYSIPIALVYFVHQRKDLPFHRIFLLFGAFIVACGSTHLMEIWTLWHPTYWLSGYLKIITASISVYTAITLVPLLPEAIALPSPAQLEVANRNLQAQIAERQRIEVELTREQEFLKAVLENAEDGIVACDANGMLALFNRATRKLHGLPEVALSPDQWAEHYNLYLSDGKTLMEKEQIPLFRAFQGETVRNVELVVAPKLGDPRTLISSGQAILDQQGQRLGAVVAMHDITERKQAEAVLRSINEDLERRVVERTAELDNLIQQLQAEIIERQRIEEALRESEQLFRATFNQAAVGIAVVDLNASWLSVNQRFHDITGYSQNDLSQFSFKEITHPDDLVMDLQGFDRLLASEISIHSLEKRFRHKRGDYIWVNLTVSLIRSLAGVPKYSIAVVEDISQRKHIEAEIQRTLQRERELSTLKSQFITTVSHEFRSPLTAIASSATLLEEKTYAPDNPRRAQHFKQIQSGVQRMTQVLEDALTLTTLETEKLNLNFAPLDLAILCQNVVTGWKLPTNSRHHLLFANSSKMALHVYADSSLMQKVVKHLLSNAIYYSPQGGPVLLELSCSDSSATIQIHDKGIGIPTSELANVFDKFYRASNANIVPGTPGAGIGLAIAKNIIALHKGRIDVVSQVNEGSTFIISIPLSISL